MKYKIVYHEDPDKLALEVLKEIEDGWKPLGGVAASISTYATQDRDGYSVYNCDRVFAQAMIYQQVAE